MNWIPNIVLAVVVAVVVILGCTLVGSILVGLNVSIAVVVGSFLKTFANVIGVLAGLFYLFKRV